MTYDRRDNKPKTRPPKTTRKPHTAADIAPGKRPRTASLAHKAPPAADHPPATFQPRPAKEHAQRKAETDAWTEFIFAPHRTPQPPTPSPSAPPRPAASPVATGKPLQASQDDHESNATPPGQTSSQPPPALDQLAAELIALIDTVTADAEEQRILDILAALSPSQYHELLEHLRLRQDGSDTYLARLYQDLHGQEFQQYLALDHAKRIAHRAGSPDNLFATMAALQQGQGIPTYSYAPSLLTVPETWDERSYPHEAEYDDDGHVRLLWRTHPAWYHVHGHARGLDLPPDALIRVHNRVTGSTDILTAAQVKALADQHETDANVAKFTVIGIAAGVALLGASKTWLGKLGTALFEIVLPAAGQYIADHQQQIVKLQGGREFVQAWQLFNLGIAGFGLLRLAWGPGRALADRVRASADQLVKTNPDDAVAAATAAHVHNLERAIDEVQGAARLLAATNADDQAVRLLAALEHAGMDTSRIAGLGDDAVRALAHADHAMAQGRMQRAAAHLDQVGLSPSEQQAVRHALHKAHGGLITDAVTPMGKPVPPLSDRIPEHKVSRAGGGFSDGVRAKQRVRARRRQLESTHGKDYVNELSDSEIYAENLYRGERRVKDVIPGEPKAAARLGMKHKIARNERPMVDLVVEERHGWLVPTEVKNQELPELSGQRSAAVHKFQEIAGNAPKEILERIHHYEVICHRTSAMPANFKVTTGGEVWHLVDGTVSPQVWQRWEFGGKPVILRRGDLGKISR